MPFSPNCSISKFCREIEPLGVRLSLWKKAKAVPARIAWSPWSRFSSRWGHGYLSVKKTQPVPRICSKKPLSVSVRYQRHSPELNRHQRVISIRECRFESHPGLSWLGTHNWQCDSLWPLCSVLSFEWAAGKGLSHISGWSWVRSPPSSLKRGCSSVGRAAKTSFPNLLIQLLRYWADEIGLSCRSAICGFESHPPRYEGEVAKLAKAAEE